MRTHAGSCHCGRVRFEVDADAALRVTGCNCSMCRLTGYLHLIVPATRFRLVAGDEVLRSYRFNTGTANHLFCSVCGIKAFYVPRSHPDGYSINARCLESDTIESLVVEREFDGRNWEQHIHELAPLVD
ncbi:MAG TPA: GFA family protein [Gammaproteobacteria bacterium]|nr:GFA family protein [Gammaproteobacteria bacterium]